MSSTREHLAGSLHSKDAICKVLPVGMIDEVGSAQDNDVRVERRDALVLRHPVAAGHVVNVVTPRGSIYHKKRARFADNQDNHEEASSRPSVRRALFPDGARPAPITPARPPLARFSVAVDRLRAPPAKRRLIFGRLVDEIVVPSSVREVYAIVRKLTGSIGGNASFGPIYGELTMVSMQKMINLMKEHAELNSSSRFIDVGSGIGKPNLHAAQDPGVEFSYGIEVEYDRWILGMSCLKGVLEAACAQEDTPYATADEGRIRHRCIFAHADIRQAKVFDPFTHVYMFSIGFPPALWLELAEIWNRSSSAYLICYHGTRDIIDGYCFDVDLVCQTSTSMHGSKEGHTGYIYRRRTRGNEVVLASDIATAGGDPLFMEAWSRVRGNGPVALKDLVEKLLNDSMTSGGPWTRTRRRARVSDDNKKDDVLR